LKTSVRKKFPPEKIMEKPEFENFASILDNFDAFCDAFETRAAEAFMRGDSDNGKFNRAVTESGGDAPEVVQEIGGSGNAPIEIGETFVDVSPSSVE
jgi:hypothetical protein